MHKYTPLLKVLSAKPSFPHVKKSGEKRVATAMLATFNVLWLAGAAACVGTVGWLMASAFALPPALFLLALVLTRRPVLAVQLSAPFWLLLGLGSWMMIGDAGRVCLLLLPMAPLSAMIVGRGRDGVSYVLIALMGAAVVWLLKTTGFVTPSFESLSDFTHLLTFPAAVGLAGLILTANFAQAGRERQRGEHGSMAPEVPLSGCLVRARGNGIIKETQGDRSMLAPGRGNPGEPLRQLFSQPQAFGDWLATIEPGVQADRLALPSHSPDVLAVTAYRRQDTSVDVLIRTADSRPDLIARAQRAEDTLKSRTAFFAGLGHDLKTPLNAIIGFSDMMRQGILGPIGERYRDRAGLIHQSAEDLLLQVEDLMELAKSETGEYRLHKEPVDLMASAKAVAHQLSGLANNKQVTLRLRTETDAWADADPRAVRQIWQNLVSNALKYSPDGGEVVLTTRADTDRIILGVADDGEGMTEEELKSAATPFAQGANAKGRPGTGLGLAIVHRLASLHGGRVRIETAPGEGTLVEVSFGRSTERAETVQAAE